MIKGLSALAISRSHLLTGCIRAAAVAISCRLPFACRRKSSPHAISWA
jgi:hypothetical protein